MFFILISNQSLFWRDNKMNASKEVTYDDINHFIIAIRCCNMEEIKSYLQDYNPIIVNRVETQTRQPSLYFSACLIDHQQSYEIMKLLIQHGANPHFKDNFQQTVLFYVCRDGKEKCLDLLIQQGLDLNEKDLYGQTPIYYAAKENRLNIISKLIENKADLNIKDNIAEQTPLFYAAKEGHLEMCKLLIENGCDFTLLDSNSKMASHIAKKFNRLQVFEYLNNELQVMKEKQSLIAEPPLQSNLQEEKKVKTKKKDPAVFSSPKIITTVYKLYRADNFGNINQVTIDEVEDLLSHHPQLNAMMKNPDQIDLTQIEEIKNEDIWQKVCYKALMSSWKAKGGYHFHEPVDPSKFGIQDYFEIVTEPMDLGTVKKKLVHNVYENSNQFCRDMCLIFDNCVKYNGTENMYGKSAIQLKTQFENQMKQMGYLN